MLKGKNTNHRYFLDEWENLDEIIHSPIRPTGNPPEAGIAWFEKENSYEIGIYYATATQKEIFQFYDEIYLFNMNEGDFFTKILETHFQTSFKAINEEIRFLVTIVDRFLFKDFYNWDKIDKRKNDSIVKIFNMITNEDEIIKREIPKIFEPYDSFYVVLEKTLKYLQGE